jgi:hypothetical protein
MRFEVEPQALASQAPVLGGLAGRLGEVAGETSALVGAAGATGSPEAAAALERFVHIWSESVLLMADNAAALGAATGSAATAYTTVDAGVMPAGR